jgi:hypothetical protein
MRAIPRPGDGRAFPARDNRGSASEKGGSEVLQWTPRLRLALIVLVVIALALTLGVSWATFLEW